jgi:hypothetical protein
VHGLLLLKPGSIFNFPTACSAIWISAGGISSFKMSSFYLLDWEYAGFYPREFEKYCIVFIGQKEDYNYAYDLSNALDSVYQEVGKKIEDEHIIGLLDRVYRNNLKYSLCVYSE